MNADPGRVQGEPTDQDKGTGLEGLPGWLQPGVSPTIHYGLRVILLLQNCLLFSFAAMGLFSPHFEIMLLLSLGLTGCYFWFCWEMTKVGQATLEDTNEVPEEGESKESKKKA